MLDLNLLGFPTLDAYFLRRLEDYERTSAVLNKYIL